MTSLLVLGAERSGVSILAHALAHAEALPLCDDLGLAAERLGAGARLVGYAVETEPDCPQLARLPDLLARFPQARAVVTWRQAVDFVCSRLRARPDRPFVDHCLLWARSLEQALSLRARFADRVGLVEFAAMIDLSSPQARRRPLVPGFDLTGEALAQSLASARGRGSLMPQRPIADAPRTSWAMGEVEAFARICGPMLARLGQQTDVAAAARRRPLDLARLFYARAYRIGGLDIAPSPAPGAAWTLALSDAPATPQLRLTAVAAGERRRLRLKWRAGGAPALSLRLEVVEAQTRRPLFIAADGAPDIDAHLPAHDGMIEMALVGARGEAPAGAWRDLVDAKLSHA